MKFRSDTRALRRFRNALAVAGREVDDLTIPLTEIAKRFFESRKFIFGLKSRGKYDELNPRYADQKQRDLGFKYPILRRSGKLERSVTRIGAPNNVFKIHNKKTLEVGTKVDYGPWHQHGTRNMPQRPFLFWGPEAKKYSNPDQEKKLSIGIATTLFDHVNRKLSKRLSARQSRVLASEQAKRLYK